MSNGNGDRIAWKVIPAICTCGERMPYEVGLEFAMGNADQWSCKCGAVHKSEPPAGKSTPAGGTATSQPGEVSPVD